MAKPEKSRKGPHVLELNTPVSSTWTEENPEKKDNPGAPVVFTFNLPAPITSNLSISDGFRVSLYKNNSGSPEFTFSGRKKSDLEKGNYRLLVEPLRKGNLAPYQVSVNTNDLIDNLSYNVTRPKTIRVSVGNTSVVELMSQGTLDVSAQLLDESAKKVIASNDDSYLDWNFAISRILKPGRYFLKINSPEEQFTSTRVFMRSLADTLMDTIYSSGTVKAIRCNLNRHIGIFPVSLSDTGDVICCALQGSAQTGCSIERRVGSEWLPIAQSQVSPCYFCPKRQRGRISYPGLVGLYSKQRNHCFLCNNQHRPVLVEGYFRWFYSFNTNLWEKITARGSRLTCKIGHRVISA